MLIVNQNMTKSIFIKNDMATILNFVNKKLFIKGTACAPNGFVMRRFNLKPPKTSDISQNRVP